MFNSREHATLEILHEGHSYGDHPVDSAYMGILELTHHTGPFDDGTKRRQRALS